MLNLLPDIISLKSNTAISTMYDIATLVVFPCFLFLRFILYPVYQYVLDPKGLRKYPNLSAISEITDIPYMIESRSGQRSLHLAELHQKHPVLRVWPNALSYGSVQAIKVTLDLHPS